MSMSAEDLDAAMNERRLELRIRWSQLAQAAGMDPGNLRRIRAGQVALTDFAARGIDTAAKWPAGTALSYWAKGVERPKPGSDAWWDDLASKLPEKDFLEVVEVAKRNRARVPKPVTERNRSDVERNTASTQSRETGP